MAFWNVDLSTRDGAMGAAQLGGGACFAAAALAGVGLAAVLIAAGGVNAASLTSAAGVVVEMLVFAIAGLRLRRGRGVGWGIAAALLLLVEIVAKLVTMTGVGGLVVNGLVLVAIVTGIRGARALASGTLPDEDVAEVFS
jgi:hypothetical protein